MHSLMSTFVDCSRAGGVIKASSGGTEFGKTSAGLLSSLLMLLLIVAPRFMTKGSWGLFLLRLVAFFLTFSRAESVI
jgi:hypothetical protein